MEGLPCADGAKAFYSALLKFNNSVRGTHEIGSGQLEAPTPVDYLCEGRESTPFFAAFYNETDPPSAVLTWGNDQVIAFIARSGSGARYTAANVRFWEHHGEATVDWFGEKLTCTVRYRSVHRHHR